MYAYAQQDVQVLESSHPINIPWAPSLQNCATEIQSLEVANSIPPLGRDPFLACLVRAKFLNWEELFVASPIGSLIGSSGNVPGLCWAGQLDHSGQYRTMERKLVPPNGGI